MATCQKCGAVLKYENASGHGHDIGLCEKCEWEKPTDRQEVRRDLQKDLEFVRNPGYPVRPVWGYIYVKTEETKVFDIAEHAIERAIKAEALNKELAEALENYEQWEADLLLADDAWHNTLPVFTQELYDKWMELQKKRNAILTKVKEAAE